MTISPRHLLFILGLIAACQLSLAKPALAADSKPLGLAQGAGVWVNIWNYPENNLDEYFGNLKRHGIANYFIQTSRSNTPAVKNPEQLGLIIEACHRHNIRVIAWSFGELINPVSDAQKLVDAANFRSANNERLDGIAANLEKNLSWPRIEVLHKHLKAKLGDKYPLMAVVYSPLNKAPEVKRVPWAELATHFDIIAPMCYWGGKAKNNNAYQYTRDSIDEVRRLCKRSDIELHIIGDGMGTDPSTLSEFMRACKEKAVPSASLYPNFKVTEPQLVSLSHYSEYFEPNSRFAFSAFREMLSSACLDSPSSLDPSEPIARGTYYKLLVKRLNIGAKNKAGHTNSTNQNIDEDFALHTLINSGLLAIKLPNDRSVVEQFLYSPISSDEALEVLAKSVDKPMFSHANKTVTAYKHKRMDNWFVQPAEAQNLNKFNKKLTYLDAAKMVFQASLSLGNLGQ